MITLRDIVETCTGSAMAPLFRPNYKWSVENNKVVMQPDFDVDLDAEVEVNYYWYDHLHPDFRNKKSDEIFEKKDFRAFMALFDKAFEQEQRDGFIYMGAEAFVCTPNCEQEIGDLIITNEKTFQLITHAEHECG